MFQQFISFKAYYMSTTYSTQKNNTKTNLSYLGQGRMINNLSPVRIVKNPDGSLAQAAMMQVLLMLSPYPFRILIH